MKAFLKGTCQNLPIADSKLETADVIILQRYQRRDITVQDIFHTHLDVKMAQKEKQESREAYGTADKVL